MLYYYSLKTKKEEHTLEPRGGDFDYAVYNLKEELLIPKVAIKSMDVVEFLWNKQKELKAVFKKTEVKPTVKADEEKKENKEKTVQEIIEEKIQEGIKEGWDGVHVEKETLSTEEVRVNKTKIAIQSKEKDSIMNHDNEYIVVARLDRKTDLVSLEVHSTPKTDMLLSVQDYEKIIDKLFFSVVASFPDLVEHYIVSSAQAQSGGSYEDCLEAYRSRRSLLIKVYGRIADTLFRAVTLFKETSKSV